MWKKHDRTRTYKTNVDALTAVNVIHISQKSGKVLPELPVFPEPDFSDFHETLEFCNSPEFIPHELQRAGIWWA